VCAPEDHRDDLGRVIARERRAWVAAARAEGLGAEDAVDCVHDALSAFVVARRAPGFDVPHDRWAAYVAVMVKNAARNRRRKHDRSRPHAPIDDHPFADPSPSAHDLVARAQDEERLRACIAELTDVQRAAVTLRLFEERSGQDVARELAIARGHVDVLVHRAKGALRACMCAGDDASSAAPAEHARTS
jgi:RNA polymerase sigma-70 factor (ECF subfamily)